MVLHFKYLYSIYTLAIEKVILYTIYHYLWGINNYLNTNKMEQDFQKLIDNVYENLRNVPLSKGQAYKIFEEEYEPIRNQCWRTAYDFAQIDPENIQIVEGYYDYGHTKIWHYINTINGELVDLHDPDGPLHLFVPHCFGSPLHKPENPHEDAFMHLGEFMGMCQAYPELEYYDYSFWDKYGGLGYDRKEMYKNYSDKYFPPNGPKQNYQPWKAKQDLGLSFKTID